MPRVTRNTWRFFDTGARSGAFNMGLDLALMEEMHESPETALPSLRLYAWAPPCVSLGYHQRAEEIDFDRVHRAGFDLTRRPTGGRAVLHFEELTYSVVVPADVFGGPTTVIESYRILSDGLVRGLTRMGIDAMLAPGVRSEKQAGSPACFAAVALCDLVSSGRKIVGSAQVRRKGVILQHGSIPLIDREETERVALMGEGAPPISGMTCLTEAAGRPIGYAEAAGAVREGFIEAFGLDLVETQVSPDLEEAAATLGAECDPLRAAASDRPPAV